MTDTEDLAKGSKRWSAAPGRSPIMAFRLPSTTARRTHCCAGGVEIETFLSDVPGMNRFFSVLPPASLDGGPA